MFGDPGHFAIFCSYTVMQYQIKNKNLDQMSICEQINGIKGTVDIILVSPHLKVA